MASLTFCSPTNRTFSFVCTLFADDMDRPVLLRTYGTTRTNDRNLTILQAARATSAAPTFFKAANLGDPTLRYVNGGLRANNPVRYVLNEAKSQFPGRHISVLLSLGTGKRNTPSLPPSTLFQNLAPTKVLRSMIQIVTDCGQEADAMTMLLDYAHQSSPPPLYVRLTVDEGLEDVALDDWRKLWKVMRDTNRYLDKLTIQKIIDDLVQGK